VLAVLAINYCFGDGNGLEPRRRELKGTERKWKGKIKQKWGQWTDDDLAQINGRRDQLEGKIQQRYGLAKDLVRKDIDDWLDAQP
jgi:uncharacterized protein YjbJ (UPF0337 family)